MSTAYNLGYRTIAIDPIDLFDKEKIHRIILSIKEKYPNEKVFGIGVEYGANLLINVAGEYPSLFQGLVSVGNPFNISKAEINLQNSWLWKLLYLDILKQRIKKGQSLNKKLNAG
jgi:predicted alpha/beta-fold hydrolase